MKKITLMAILLTIFSFSSYAQFGCGSGVVLSNGFTQYAITTPGDGGEEDWNTNPTGTTISASYFDDDVYLFQYTAGAVDVEISMTIFSRKSYNGIGIFSTCTGTTFSGELDAMSTSGANSTKTVSAIVSSGTTVYIAVGQFGTPNDLDFDVTKFIVTPLTSPPNCDSALLTPTNGTTTAAINGNLTWSAATGVPLGYLVSMGTTPGGTDVLNAVNVGNVLTYNPGVLLPATTYYVTIVPTNSNGNATTCTEYSFTTCGPNEMFYENFDSSATGASSPMPDCWSKAGNGTVYVSPGSNTPNSAPNRLYMLANGTATSPTNSFAITPTISNLQEESHRLRFKVYASTLNKTLDVGYFTDMSDTDSFVAIEVLSLPGTSVASALEFIVEPTSVPVGVTNLVFRNSAPTGSTSIYIDDVIWELIPACADITTVQIQNFNSTSATLIWNPGETESDWDYVYALESVTDPTTLTPVAVSIESTAILSNLTPATTYKIWVRSNCGDGAIGNWPVVPYKFTTACTSITEFSENFDSYATGSTAPLPDCWTNFGSTGSSYITSSSNDPMSAPNRLYMYTTTLTKSYAVFPPVSNLQAETHRLKFKGYTTSAGKSIEIGYFEVAGSAESFVVLETIEMPSTSLAAAAEFIYIPQNVPDGIESIAFRLDGSAYTSTTIMYFDDVAWELIPSCADITVFELSNITSTTIDVVWTPGGSEGSWEYVYAESTVTDPSTLTPTTVLGTPYISLSELAPNTEYNIWIRSVCGTNDLGNWSVPQTFTTSCALVATFYENFDSSATGNANPFTDCWIKAGNGLTYITTGSTEPGSAPNRLYMSANGTATTPTEAIAIMPPISNLADGTHRLRFKAYSTSANKSIEIGYYNDIADLSSYMPLEIIQLSGTSPATAGLHTYIPVGIPEGVTHIAFKNQGLPTSYVVYVDDVSWELLPLCPDVNSITFEGATSSSASFTWIPGGSETAWEYVYDVATTTDPSTLSPVAVNDNPATTIQNLTPATTYKLWIRSTCGTDFGVYSVPIIFNTECANVTEFVQDFDTTVAGFSNPLPLCWEELGNATVYVASGSVLPGSAPNRLYMSASGTSGTQAIAVMQAVSNLQAETHNLKFKAYSSALDRTLDVGYFTDYSDLSSFVVIETIALPGTAAATALEFTINPTNIPVGVDALAFRNIGIPTGSTTAYIDDVIWAEKSTVLPTCTTNIVATPNSICGNFATTITWDASANADGYNISIGTTSGATDVFNNEDFGSSTSLNFIGNFNTTYYYTVMPYNSVGTAIGCTEQTFTTAVNGCYCPAQPTSNDNAGITNVQIATQNFPTADVTYFDHSATAVDLAQGVSANLQVSFATGYTYNTNVWIDLNNNYIFEEDELFFQGESLSANPTVLNASFLMPVTASLGLHRMRIVATDILQNPANPCYSGSYGIVLDFSVNIIAAPSCLAPTALTVDQTTLTATGVTVNWDESITAASGYDYYVSEINTQPSETTVATGSVAMGINTVDLMMLSPITTYYVWIRSNCSSTESSEWSSSVTFTTPCTSYEAPFMQDFTTFLPSCWATASEGTIESGPTNTSAGIWNTDGFLNVGSAGAATINLFSTNRIGWLITPSLTTIVGETYTFSFDYGITSYSGTTASAMGTDDSVKIAMSIDNGATWTQIQNFTNASGINNSLQEFVYEFEATTANAKFAFIGTDGTTNDVEDYNFYVDNVGFEINLSSTNFDLSQFIAYPNPVKDLLTIRYNENITSASVFNLLGQQLFTKAINATEGQIDMSSLASGTYLIKVSSGDRIKTLKVIKK